MSGTDTIYQAVTDKMVAALEAGTVPWRKPWHAAQGMPASMSTGRAYRGVNIFLLALTAADAGYTSPWWGTYRQIQELGGQVRKGERSTMVVFWKRLIVDDRHAVGDDGKPRKVAIPMLRYFRVFNAGQADGLPARYHPAPGETPVDETAEAIIKRFTDLAGSPAVYYDGGDRAYYSPAYDTVHLPSGDAFDNTAERYSTTFHELGHATGHASRLNRPGITDSESVFGCETYSREELVAEFTSAMLCAVAGVTTDAAFANSAAYIAGWLRALKGDTKLAVNAAANAQRAADLIRGVTYTDTSDDDS